MRNNLHVSYDLYRPNQNYDAVIQRIKELGSWAKIHKSFWYVKSNYNALQAAEYIKTALDENDTLYIVDSTNNDAYWFNLEPEVAAAIQQNWSYALGISS